MKEQKLVVVIYIFTIILVISIMIDLRIQTYFLNKNREKKDNYVETHMEYEPDKKFISTLDPNNSFTYVNNNPIIPTGYFRQRVEPKDPNDIVRIVYYIPEKYVGGNSTLMGINGNENVKITTKVTDIPLDTFIGDIDNYLENIINDFSSEDATKSIEKIDCGRTIQKVIKTEYEDHIEYELIFIYEHRAYSLIYDISKKANIDNEIEIMKKVFSSMKLLNIALHVE